MGIVSSAKSPVVGDGYVLGKVSIPDGDSFLREEVDSQVYDLYIDVSIPDGDSFLREV